jgi:hypothetical protein
MATAAAVDKYEPYTPKRLMLTCPFCGSPAQIRYWHGGGPRKRCVECSNEYCYVGPSVCGPTEDKAIDRWNMRGGQR